MNKTYMLLQPDIHFCKTDSFQDKNGTQDMKHEH